MKKIILKEHVRLTGTMNCEGSSRQIDFYIEQPGKAPVYAFSKKYTQGAYELCKSGIRVNELSVKRSRDRSVMRLVDYLNVMLPYLCEYYELPVMAG